MGGRRNWIRRSLRWLAPTVEDILIIGMDGHCPLHLLPSEWYEAKIIPFPLLMRSAFKCQVPVVAGLFSHVVQRQGVGLRGQNMLCGLVFLTRIE